MLKINNGSIRKAISAAEANHPHACNNQVSAIRCVSKNIPDIFSCNSRKHSVFQ